MKEVSKTGHFTIDLPSSDAATALSGQGNSFLKKFESLTGVSLTIRGLQLEMNGVMSKIERASALVELTRPIWEQGLEVPEVDLKAALRSTSGTSNPCSQIGLVSSTNAEALSILDMTPFISSCKPLIVKDTPVRDSNFFKKELPGPDNAVAASELGKSILK